MNFEGRKGRTLFAITRPPHLETIEQQCLFSWIGSTARLYPEGSDERETLDWIHSIPNGAHVAKGHARRLVAEGLKSGILDISCDEPRAHWHGLRIEMKRRGEKPSENQERYMRYLDRIGVRREVCYSWQAAARLVIEYLGLARHAPIYE
jgi:hypothetical protein